LKGFNKGIEQQSILNLMKFLSSRANIGSKFKMND